MSMCILWFRVGKSCKCRTCALPLPLPLPLFAAGTVISSGPTGSIKGANARDLKPTSSEKKKIFDIISSPSRHITGAQKGLLWRYRYSLTENKRALNKFLRSVDWADQTESKQVSVGGLCVCVCVSVSILV